MQIKEQFDTYLSLYDIEDEGIKKILKSILTAKIKTADKARDDIWRGMIHINSAALLHFNPEMQEAGKHLKILFKTYGNIATKPLSEQTSATYNILQELQGEYAEHVEIMGITEWVAELKTCNDALEKLMNERYGKTSGKSNVVVKEARIALDKSYHGIIERLAALALLEGEAIYAPFMRELNTITDRYALILNQRYGKKAASQPK